MQPTLYIVNGLPGTGKTTLAEEISKKLSLPLFSKDSFKEILFDTIGIEDKEHSMRLGKASMLLMFHAAESVLSQGTSCIIEGNFNPHFGMKDIAALQENVRVHVVQIFCRTESSIRVARILARVAEGTRHVGHGDPKECNEAQFIELLHQELDPMDIPEGQLLEIDTSTKTTKEHVDELKARL